MEVFLRIHFFAQFIVELFALHIGFVNNFTFQKQPALAYSVGRDFFRALGVQVQRFEFIGIVAAQVVAHNYFVAHILNGNGDCKATGFVDKAVREFAFTDGENKNGLIPESSERTPMRRHYVNFFFVSARNEYAALSNGF